MSRQMIDFSRPYTGPNLCDRCKPAGRPTSATRRVYGPDGDAVGWMCRDCADVWNRCIQMAFDKAAAELAEKVRQT